MLFRSVERVLGLKNDVVGIDPDTLQGGLVVADHDGSYLAGADFGLGLDADDVSVEDPGVNHGIASADESEVAFDVIGNGIIIFNIILSQDGISAGDPSQSGDFICPGHRLYV